MGIFLCSILSGRLAEVNHLCVANGQSQVARRLFRGKVSGSRAVFHIHMKKIPARSDRDLFTLERNSSQGTHFPRSIRYSAIFWANRRPARAASAGELPAAPTSTSREPVVACWLYREFRSRMGRISVG